MPLNGLQVKAAKPAARSFLMLLTGLALRRPLAAQLHSAASSGAGTRVVLENFSGLRHVVFASGGVVRPALNAEALCEMLDNSKPKLLTPSGLFVCHGKPFMFTSSPGPSGKGGKDGKGSKGGKEGKGSMDGPSSVGLALVG